MRLVIDATELRLELRIWGCNAVQRLIRSFRNRLTGAMVITDETALRDALRPFPNVEFVHTDKALSREELLRGEEAILWLSGHVVYDPRVMDALARSEDSLLIHTPDREMMAARILASDLEPSGTFRTLTEQLYQNAKIRKMATTDMDGYVPAFRINIIPFMIPIRAKADVSKAEHALFRLSYKGSMDWVYAYVYRPIVRTLMHGLCRLPITPNQISFGYMGVACLALGCYAMGEFAYGLMLSAVTMVADAVDGVLARLTFQTSALGHALDKVSHSIYHPLWYLGMAAGLEFDPEVKFQAVVLIVLYFSMKPVTILFNRRFGFSIYDQAWYDRLFRLITGARWNMNMMILAVGLWFEDFRTGFYAICLWGVFSVTYWAFRFLWALSKKEVRPYEGRVASI